MFVDSPLFLGAALFATWLLVVLLYHYPEPSSPAAKRSTAATGSRPDRPNSPDRTDRSAPGDGSTATCPRCGAENAGEYRFCRACTSRVRS
ncbi:zinc ribbon domain-containing protein [Halobium salinum]|uniref:zinc ribbon domain-containing protein n=1 Tax=Halobium salinum TaxID=1364940 RepID=UPI003CCC91C7